MKSIPTTFVSNNDKCGNCSFSLIKKDAATNVMMYKRVNDETQATAYEVFAAKTVKAGSPLPNGTVVAEDYEQYPGSSAFGKTAYFCTTVERAEFRFKQLVDKVNGNIVESVSSDSPDTKKTVSSGVRGRKKAIRPEVVFPTSVKSFVIKDLLGINKAYTQPTLYVEIQQLIKNHKVKVIGTQPNESGRGKPAVVYSLA